ncbi:MAG: ABC transporter ATP-binding protein [Candidatus Saccharimonadales bacterium]
MIKQAPKQAKKVLVTVSNVTKRFQTSAGEMTAIKQADFVIEDGSFTVIYGRSGSGKSTLLNTIAGLELPTEGSVKYEGIDVYTMNDARRAHLRGYTLGMVHQQNHWVDSLTVAENVALPLHFLGYSRSDAHEAALASLRRIKMEAFADKYPSMLSGGEQQRIAMARATVNNPLCIIADEPTGNLDSYNGDAMIELLQYFHKELHRTIVLVTHNLEYLSVGDKLLLVDDGIVTETHGNDLRNTVTELLKDMQTRIKKWQVSKA